MPIAPTAVASRMLPPGNRMRRSTDFTSVVRGGVRTRRGSLVVHHRPSLRDGAQPLVGLVVGRGVGPSVVRHRVSRRLRALLRERLDVLGSGSGTVVRALPGAATARSAQLSADLDAALDRIRRSPAERSGS